MPRVRIRNGNSALLIDENYANLALRQKGSVVTGAANSYGYSVATLTLANDQSVVAMRCASRCAIYNVTYGSGSVTYTFFCQGGGVTIEYWNFDLPKYSEFNPLFAKLIVRHPVTGEKVYDSRLRYMRVVNFQYTNGGNSAPEVVNNYSADVLPAVVISNQSWSMRSERTGIGAGSSTIVAQALGAFRTSGSTVTLTQLWVYANFTDTNSSGTYPNSEMLDGYWMTLDVSNFA